jgi:hypothetical protein
MNGDRGPRPSHTGGPGAWVGVVREGRKVVWTCPHRHGNRDAGNSAYQCVRLYMRAPDRWQELEDQRVAGLLARQNAGWI